MRICCTDILPIPHFSGKGAVSTQVIAADSSFSSDSSSNYEEDDYSLPRLSIDEWHDAAPQKTRSTSRSATKISKTNGKDIITVAIQFFL